MEKVYRKVGRKYESCGYNNTPDLSDGIWMVQSKPHSSSMSSMIWKIGNIDRPCDVLTHAALQSISDDIAQYVVRLSDATSSEFIEAKDNSGGYIKEPIGFYNISASDITSLILRRIATHLEDGERLHWDSLQMKFRDEYQLHTKPEFNNGVKVLYKFTEWLKENGIKFRQGKNIG